MSELTRLIRSKYPGAYDDKTDEELDAAWLKKYPGVQQYEEMAKLPPQTPVEGFVGPVQPPSAMHRFLTPIAESWSPSAIINGIGAMLPSAENPYYLPDAIVNTLRASGNRLANAYQDAKDAAHAFSADPRAASFQGLNALRNVVAAVPIFGEGGARAGEAMAKGDVAGGLGQIAALASNLYAPKIMGTVPKVGTAVKTATADIPYLGAAVDSAYNLASSPSRLPRWLSEKGLQVSAGVRKDFPNTDFGQTALDYRTYTSNKAQSVLDQLRTSLENNVDKTSGTVSPAQIKNDAYQIAAEKARIDVGNSSTAQKTAALENEAQKFMDQYITKVDQPVVIDNGLQQPRNYFDPPEVQGPYHAINVEMQPVDHLVPMSPNDLLNVQRVSGHEAGWTKAVNQDPTRALEFWKQGESLAARNALDNLMTSQGLPSAIANLKKQQNILGVMEALKAREGAPSTLRTLAEVGAITADPVKGLKYTGLIEGVKNPRVMGAAAVGSQLLGRMSPALFKAILLSNQADQDNSYFNNLQ